MKKKILIFLFIIVLSLAFTFILFEQLSWYHFGDIPTKVVLYRLILFFLILNVFILGIYWVIIRNRKIKKAIRNLKKIIFIIKITRNI